MAKHRYLVSGLLGAALAAGCATSVPAPKEDAALVGAWIVTVARPAGVGKNMLTFSSDGTFFRSGDTHPVLSVGHGAWRRANPGEFDATYIAFRFDDARKWIGSTQTSIHIVAGPEKDAFTGVAKVSTRDLQDKETGVSEVRLQGKRIQVQTF